MQIPPNVWLFMDISRISMNACRFYYPPHVNDMGIRSKLSLF